MRKFNRYLHALGGKYFTDADGVKFSGGAWEHVITKLRSYRKNAGQPPGDPEAEVLAQVCARHPGYCQETTQPVQPRQTRSRLAQARAKSGELSKAISNWLVTILKARRTGQAKRVNSEEARRRSAICAACPAQRAFGGVCGSCKAMRKTAKQILFNGEQSIGGKLKGCRVLQEDTSTSVHIDQPPAVNPDLPENCWRK